MNDGLLWYIIGMQGMQGFEGIDISWSDLGKLFVTILVAIVLIVIHSILKPKNSIVSASIDDESNAILNKMCKPGYICRVKKLRRTTNNETTIH